MPVANTGAIEVKSGTLDLAGGLIGAGTVIVDDGATLELAGADAQTITFSGGNGTLQLDSTELPFNGTITGQRLYQLVRQAGPVADHVFEIRFSDPGAQAYAFTFG